MKEEEVIRELKIQFVGEYDRQREAKDRAIKDIEQLQKIQEIISEHDADKLPEDYWYIDRIREVLEE